MKRSEMLRTQLRGPLDAIQMCRDIVEGNFNAHDVGTVGLIELQARIYTDLEILATNQSPIVQGRDLGDETPEPTPKVVNLMEALKRSLGSLQQQEKDYPEPSSASR